MELIISLILLICMAWFGTTFVYFLVVIRKNSTGKVGSWSLAKDINQIGKVYKKYMAIKRKQNPDLIWPYVFVVTNVISFLTYVGIFVVSLIRSIRLDIM